MEELKKCPCCGSKAVMTNNFGRKSPICSECGLSIRSDYFEGGVKRAIQAWNNRV